MAECCVLTMKASLIKTIEEGEDVDLALLTYKTTPLNHRLPSLAELLNPRKYKTLLPTRIVPPRLQESYRQIMHQGKQVQAQLYNKNTRVLLRLQQSQKVVVQLDPDKISGHQQRSSSAQPIKVDDIVLGLHMVEFTSGTGDS